MKYVFAVLFAFSSLSHATTCTEIVDSFVANFAANNKAEVLAMIEVGRPSRGHIEKETALFADSKEFLMLAHFNYDNVYSAETKQTSSRFCVAEVFGSNGGARETLGSVTVKLGGAQPQITTFQFGSVDE